MSRPSFRRGWSRARSAGRVALGAWLGRLVLALPLALGLAAGLDRLFAASSPGRMLPPDTDAEAVLRFVVALMRDLGAYGVLIATTLLAVALWELLWQGGLAAAWQDGRSPGLRRSLAAGRSLVWPLVRLGAFGLVLQGLLLGLALLATGPLLRLDYHGPWWTEPLVRVVGTAVVVAVWMLAQACVQLARWRVAQGARPLRSLIGSTGTILRHPLAGSAPVAGWLAWSLGWGVLWLATRLVGTITSTAGAWTALVLFAAVVLAETWGRAALVLAYAPPDSPSS